jgi:tocopherol O-methyltransferase
MRVNTSVSIMDKPNRIIHKIAKFWNEISFGWKTIWGPHIHHGFYETHENITPLLAQEKLIVKLASLLDLKPGQKLLDVGCGMGGSSIYLAKHYQVAVSGITLSTVQLDIANKEAQNYPELKLQFAIDDAHSLNGFADNTFDIVWALESCEQFYDKQLFIKQANRVLKPAGKLMLATWCSDQEIYENNQAKDYLKICKHFDLPYMPTLEHYRTLLNNQFTIETELDWSAYIKKSWDLGMEALKQYSIFQLLQLGGIKGIQFVSKIKLIRLAFDTGRMRYGVFIAVKNKT